MSISYEWVKRGYWYQTRSKIRLAIECYREALKEDPGNPDALQLLGSAYILNRKFDNARSILERAVAFLPDHAPVWINLGISKNETGDYRGAIKDLSRAVRLDKSLDVCWRNIANSLLQLKRYWAAIKLYYKYQNLCPGDLAVWPNIIKCYVELGSSDGALIAAGQAREAGLDDRNLWEHVAEIHKAFSSYDQIKAAYLNVLSRWPDAADAALRLSEEALGRGDYSLGWELYESRFLAKRGQRT